MAILAASGSPARSDGESRSQTGDVFLPYLALASEPISDLEVLDCSMGAIQGMDVGHVMGVGHFGVKNGV